MKVETFAAEAEAEAEHWWFVGRRTLFAREIGGAGTSFDTRVFDLGVSTGGNLRLLRDLGFTDVIGVDASDEAIRWCAEKGIGPVQKADIVDLPFTDSSAGLILATDVIEHVDDDGKALGEIARVLKPGGAALITVPAFRMLWGLQDDVAHHKRRYRKEQLEALVLASGLTIERSYYFNYLLFIPIFFARKIMRVIRPNIQSESDVNTPWLNRMLLKIFLLDVAMAPRLRAPLGVSAFLLARKPRG